MSFRIQASAVARFACGLALSALTCLAPPASLAAEMDVALVAAARKDRKLVFYASFLVTKFHIENIKGFENKYGLPVELADICASEMRELIGAELTTGKYIGDAMQNGAAELLRQAREGELQPVGGVARAANPIEGQTATEIRVPNFTLIYGVPVSTALMKPEDEPKARNDLPDPRWKGNILSDDMRAMGGGQVMFSARPDAMGKDCLRNLGSQDIVFSRDVGADERCVARWNSRG